MTKGKGCEGSALQNGRSRMRGLTKAARDRKAAIALLIIIVEFVKLKKDPPKNATEAIKRAFEIQGWIVQYYIVKTSPISRIT